MDDYIKHLLQSQINKNEIDSIIIRENENSIMDAEYIIVP